MQLHRIPWSSTFVAVVLLCCAMAGTARQVCKPWPIHHWESALVGESQRAALGMPVYEPAETGHATHMYGPLATWLVGAVFQLTGPSFLPARLISLFSISITMVLLVRATRPEKSWLSTMIAVALVAAFGRAVCDYAEPRPDCSSLLIAFCAVLVMYHAADRQSLVLWLAGSALTVGATLLKQPAALVAAIPVVAFPLESLRLRPTGRDVVRLLPLAAVLATIAVLATWFPLVFHYCIAAPSSYSIEFAEMLKWTAVLFSCLLFLLPAVAAGIADGWSMRRRSCDRKTAWLSAAVIVTVPCCLITAAKTGGMMNCLLPAFIASIGLFLHLSGPLEKLLCANHPVVIGRFRIASSTLMTVTMLAAFIVPLIENVRSDVSLGDDGFGRMVELVKMCPGRVACPQDAALLAMADRPPGRSVALEYDAAGWPESIPSWMLSDLDDADSVITLGSEFDSRAWPLQFTQLSQLLRESGFEIMADDDLHSTGYRRWQRTAGQPGTARK